MDGQVVNFNDGAIGHQHGVLNFALQLAHVAQPVKLAQQVRSGNGESRDDNLGLRGELLEKGFSQRQVVLALLAQRWQANLDGRPVRAAARRN
jgi:hypothetical protein